MELIIAVPLQNMLQLICLWYRVGVTCLIVMHFPAMQLGDMQGVRGLCILLLELVKYKVTLTALDLVCHAYVHGHAYAQSTPSRPIV